MYIVNGIAHAEEAKKPVSVKFVRLLDDFKLWLRFSTREEKVFDFKSLLNTPAYSPL